MTSGLCGRFNTVVRAAGVDVFPDVDGDGEVDIGELSTTIRIYKRKKRAGQLQAWHGNLQAQQDPVFPNWLVRRTDFRDVFSRCASMLGLIDSCVHYNTKKLVFFYSVLRKLTRVLRAPRRNSSL